MKNIAKGILATTVAGAAAVILAACGSTGADRATDVIAPAANTAPVSTAAPASRPAPPAAPTPPTAIDPDRDRGGDNDINDDKGHDVVDHDARDDHGGDRGGHHDG